MLAHVVLVGALTYVPRSPGPVVEHLQLYRIHWSAILGG